MTRTSPGESEFSCFYCTHLGPRFESAGLRIQFHHNRTPGIHIQTSVPDAYRSEILRGLGDGMSLRFPSFPKTSSIWILEVTVDELNSSGRAFYRAARMSIDQAFSLASMVET